MCAVQPCGHALHTQPAAVYLHPALFRAPGRADSHPCASTTRGAPALPARARARLRAARWGRDGAYGFRCGAQRSQRRECYGAARRGQRGGGGLRRGGAWRGRAPRAGGGVGAAARLRGPGRARLGNGRTAAPRREGGRAAARVSSSPCTPSLGCEATRKVTAVTCDLRSRPACSKTAAAASSLDFLFRCCSVNLERWLTVSVSCRPKMRRRKMILFGALVVDEQQLVALDASLLRKRGGLSLRSHYRLRRSFVGFF